MLPACASDLKEKSCKASGAKVKICWNKRTPTVSVPKLAALLQVSSTKRTSTFVKGSVDFALSSAHVCEGVTITSCQTFSQACFAFGVKSYAKLSCNVFIKASPTTSVYWGCSVQIGKEPTIESFFLRRPPTAALTLVATWVPSAISNCIS